MSNVDQAKYKVLKRSENIEIRYYPPMVVAEVGVSGERQRAINAGFKQLFNYITGDNTKSEKIAMTAPVIESANETIAMTAPVLQQEHKDKWFISFVMPEKASLESLPKPKNPQIKLKELGGRHFAVIRFSGIAKDELIQQKLRELKVYIDDNKLEKIGQPIYAFFNPPWTLPFLRHNEVMIEIKGELPTPSKK